MKKRFRFLSLPLLCLVVVFSHTTVFGSVNVTFEPATSGYRAMSAPLDLSALLAGEGVSHPVFAYAAGLHGGGTAYVIEDHESPEGYSPTGNLFVLAVNSDGSTSYIRRISDHMPVRSAAYDDFVFVWPLKDGKLLVTWEALWDESNPGVSFIILGADGTVLRGYTPIALDVVRNFPSRAAELPDGRFVVVYHDGLTGYLALFSPEGNPVTGFPSEIPHPPACNTVDGLEGLDVAAGSGGSFLVTYACGRLSEDLPYFSVLYDGEGQPQRTEGAEDDFFQVTESGVGGYAQQRVAALSDGRFALQFFGNFVDEGIQEERIRFIGADGALGGEFPTGYVGRDLRDLVSLREGGFALASATDGGIALDLFDNEGALQVGWFADPTPPGESWWMLYPGYEGGFGIMNGAASQLLTFSREVGDDPTDPTDPEEPPVSPVVRGDVDGNGQLDIADALLALRIVVGLEPLIHERLSAGDVAPVVEGISRPDGRLDIGDVIAILRKIAQLPSF